MSGDKAVLLLLSIPLGYVLLFAAVRIATAAFYKSKQQFDTKGKSDGTQTKQR